MGNNKGREIHRGTSELFTLMFDSEVELSDICV